MSTDDNEEGGNPLRERLSKTSALATDALARAVIAEEGLTFVEVGDFRGMDPTKVEDRARELNAEREASANEALGKLLKQKGVEDLDALLASPPAEDHAAEEYDAVRRTGEAGSYGGKPQVDLSGIEHNGPAQMVEHFKQKANRGKR